MATFKHFFNSGTIGSGTIKFRHFSQTEPLPQLATPQNVAVNGTTLSWDAVENATSYDIYADGTLIGNTAGGATAYAVTISVSGDTFSACSFTLYSTDDYSNPTSGTMVYSNDGLTNETVTIEVDKKYIVLVDSGSGSYGASFLEDVTGGIHPVSGHSGFVVEVLGQGTVSIFKQGCLTGDTLITLADGTKKRIDELTLQDKVLAIDTATGKFVADEITYTDSTEHKTFSEYDIWTFSDGTIIKTVRRHRFYNVEKQAMVYMDEWNIGEHAINKNGELIALVSHENVKEKVRHYTIFTKQQNYFANGLLSGNRYTAELHL